MSDEIQPDGRIRPGGARYPESRDRDGDRFRRDGNGYPYEVRPGGTDGGTLWLALGAGVLAGTLGATWYARQRAEEERRRRPPDSAPARASRVRREQNRPLVGRTVTIDKPRGEVYAYWRDFSNLASFMKQVDSVESIGADAHRWNVVTSKLLTSGERAFAMETRIVEDVENETVAWRTTEGSDIEAEGRVRFRDAPGGRGTEVAATVRYRPPGGQLGEVAATLFGLDPKTQVRHELKRLKMLLESGEIATAANRLTDTAGA